MSTPLLEVNNLTKNFVLSRNMFGRPTRTMHAVRDVSFTLERGETLAVVGESGAGKSTVGRMVLRLIEPDGGSVKLDGQPVLQLRRTDVREFRGRAQMIFQDPFSSLDPRMAVGDAIAESLAIHTDLRAHERYRRVIELLDRVGISAAQSQRYPHEFSGGQLQRIAIARALAVDPDLIVCDEPVAALDMSIRAQVINLLEDLQKERGIAYLFISHDLSLVRLIADRVAVMYRGQIVELAIPDELYTNPRHPYTQDLLRVIPVPDPRRQRHPRPSQPVAYTASSVNGCPYAAHCSQVDDICLTAVPELREVDNGSKVSCHRPVDSTSSPIEGATPSRSSA